jgi:hypothetical protein
VVLGARSSPAPIAPPAASSPVFRLPEQPHTFLSAFITQPSSSLTYPYAEKSLFRPGQTMLTLLLEMALLLVSNKGVCSE